MTSSAADQTRRERVQVLAHMRDLATPRDIWLCDIWGVVHNGIAPFPEAVNALREHRIGGGIVVLITNAPRPSPAVIGQLDGIGVPREAYDRVVTSGDSMRALIAAKPGAAVFHLGPERDRPLLEGLPISLVAEPEDAELVLCSGLFDDETETPDDYDGLLERIRARGLTLYCANPDKVVQRGGALVYCAGALAERYAALGGEVVMTGKPHDPIYAQAFAELAELKGAPVARERALVIGDGMETDLAGAARQGLDAVFVMGGIHDAEVGENHHEDDEARDALLARLREALPDLRLKALMPALA